MKETEYSYVFVVCGDKLHVETLHFSLKMLKRYTKYDIVVVTDTSRNAISIEHDNIINIITPSTLTHHQAAIYLKTFLHKILKTNHLYCYLDTDVVAISSEIDSIFNHFMAPITFCTDHCKIKAFSPNAVYDAFYDNLLEKQKKLSTLYYQYRQEEEKQAKEAGSHLEQILHLKAIFNQNRPLHAQAIRGNQLLQVLLSKLIFQTIHLYTKLIIPKNKRLSRLEKLHRRIFGTPLDFDLFSQEKGYQYDFAAKKWYDLHGRLIYEENLIVNRIESSTEFRWDTITQQWYDQGNNNISTIQSDKLIHLIRTKFGVNISNENWRHWNGGVFLFNHASAAFMEQWHQWTLEIFNDPAWKIRDQGTLIATSWKFDLQNHPTLPLVYNFIADYYHPHLYYKGNLTFHIQPHHINIKPYFIHIYHHWGDPSWQVWQDVVALATTES